MPPYIIFRSNIQKTYKKTMNRLKIIVKIMMKITTPRPEGKSIL